MAAGTCWTSNEFAGRGCDVVATAIRTIKYHGLKSAEAYFETGETHFERLCWSFGNIPFAPDTFDVVFCQNALQYVENLEDVWEEIYRVLKPGGRLVLAWTGVHGLFKSKRWGPGHSYLCYTRHIDAAGFTRRASLPPTVVRPYRVGSHRSALLDRIAGSSLVVDLADVSRASRSADTRCVYRVDGPAGHADEHGRGQGSLPSTSESTPAHVIDRKPLKQRHLLALQIADPW